MSTGRELSFASHRFVRTLVALTGAILLTFPIPAPDPMPQASEALAAPSGAPVASGWVLVKYPGAQPGCAGVGFQGAIYYDRLDCGFGYVSVSETTASSVVKVSFIAANGTVLNTQTTTFRTAEVAWEFDTLPTAAWPAGPVRIRVVEVDGVPGNFGETSLLFNQLGATVAPVGTAPGSPITVTGTTFEIDQIPPLAAEQNTNVGATFSLRVTWPDGTVRGPYGPFTASAGPIPAAGTFSATIPGAATAGLTADASTNFKATVGVEIVDATYTDPLTGAWNAARAGAGSVSFTLPPTQLILENSFVSSVGWVKPGESYPFRVIVKNYTTTARTGAVVTIPVPDGTTFTQATAVSGSGTCSIVGGAISWNIGMVAQAAGGVPTIKTCVVEARADTLVQDPRIVWKNLSSAATLTYTGGPANLTSASHGPKVIPPKSTFDTARYGDRPFPVVPVDWFDRKHAAAHTGDALSDKINSPSIAGSTFNLYQEISYGQLFPNGTVPSAGIASAGWAYGPGFDFTTPAPQGACTGTSFKDVRDTPIYAERIVGGWYQLPGDTGYYGSDQLGSALVGAQAGVGPLMQIDNACGPTGKAVFDAAQIADPEIDYSDYDTDKDGVVDFFMMVFVGVGGHGASQTSVPPYDNIWPHSSSLEFYYTDQGPYGQQGYVSDDQLKNLEGKPLYYTDAAASAMTTAVTAFPVYVRVGPYNVNPEDSIDNASVISHEYGHSLGLPDFYSLGTRETYGDWNLMATDKSQNMDVFSKQELGWLVPRVLQPGQTDVSDWTDTKENTHRIDWQQPDGTPYSLTGAGVNNGEAYVAKLPSRQILDPDKFNASGPGEGASPDHVWWSQSGNDFGCAPNGAHNLDIFLPELADYPNGTSVTVTFKSYWDIEWDYDYGFVMTSTDDGATYTSLPSANGYTEAALNPNANACQTQYGNGITGASGSFEAGTQNVDRVLGQYPDGGFLEDEYSFTTVAGSATVLRFSYATDPGLARPGWFIDDLQVVAGSDVIYESDFETSGDPDDPRVFSGGCKGTSKVAATCTDGFQYINAAEGSPADHAYYLEMRDRSGFDMDGKGENDRDPIGFLPGMLLVYTDEAHGYGNVGTDDPPAQTPLDSQPQPGNETPNLGDAAFTAVAGDNHFSDSGAGHTDNYSDPSSPDELWHFQWNCLTFDVMSMAGTDVGPGTVPPYNLEGDVRFTMGAGCSRFDYGHGGPGGPINQPPTAVADYRPTTVNVGDEVTFDGSGSFDDRQAPNELTYAWDLDDNGSFETPGQVVTRTYSAAGTYDANLRVTDAGGLSDTDTVTVTVSGPEPCPPFTATGSYSDDFEPGAQSGWVVDTAQNALPTSVTWAVRPDPLAHSPSGSFHSDATTLDLKDDRLIAPAQDLSTESQLIFWHRFGFESPFDGGVLEVSTNNGSTWTDVLTGGGSFAQGGYNGTISAGFNNPIAGRSAWTGPVEGAAAPMTQVVANLGAYAGNDVLVRFRLGTDALAPGALPGAGWWIDDVSFTKLLEPATCANNDPIAIDDSANTTMNTPVTINVLGNDGDPDGDAVTVTAVSNPPHGTAVINPNGTVTYTPDSGYTGSDSFTYTISDGRGGTDTATVAVTVTGAGNRPPNANDDTATTQENTPVTINVIGNDGDPDGDPLMVTAFSDPPHGSVVNNGNGTLTYTPDAGFFGTDTFTYTISDGRGGSDTANVTVTVTEAPNQAPNAVDDQATTTQNTPIRINVVANDSDPDNDPLSVSNVSDPPHGTAVSNGDGTVTYTPEAGFTGTDTFSYTISDGHGGTDTATVTVFVNAPSDSQKATGGGWILVAGEKMHFSFNAQVKNGAAKGKINYHDQSGDISIKGTVDTLRISGPPTGSPPASGSVADFSGQCTLANGAQCSYTAHVEDKAEPGKGWDVFSIRIFNASGTLIHEASGVLGGGNIQIH